MNHTFLSRRRSLAWAGAGGLTLGLGGCGLLSKEQSIRISRDRLQQRLSGTFPKSQRLLELLDVRMDVPTVTFESGRLAMRIPTVVSERISGETLEGVLGFNAVPRWEPSDQTIRLSQVKATELSLKGFGGRTPAWLQRLGGVVAERTLNDFSVYQASGEQLTQLQRFGFRPSAVRVNSDSMELVLAPEGR